MKKSIASTVRISESASRNGLLDSTLVHGFAACRLLAEYVYAKEIDRDMLTAAVARHRQQLKLFRTSTSEPRRRRAGIDFKPSTLIDSSVRLGRGTGT